MGTPIPQLTDSAALDLIKSIQPEVPKEDFDVICQNYTDYFMSRFLMDAEEQGGAQVEHNLMIGTSGNAQMTQLYEEMSVAKLDVIRKSSFRWAMATTAYMIDSRELAMNTSSKKKLFDLIKKGRTDANLDLAELLEQQLWQYPTYGDEKQLYGVPYWVVKNATEGFNGAAPSGFTYVGGLDPTATGLGDHKNYTAGAYTTIKDAEATTDLIYQMRVGAIKIGFKAPAIVKDIEWAKPKRACYTVLSVLLALENVAKSNNDSLGFDIAPATGRVTFLRTPIEYVPYLENDSTTTAGASSSADPLYMLDHNTLKAYALRGWRLKEHEPCYRDRNRNVMLTQTDTVLQLGCTRRKSNAVFSL